MSHRRVVGLFLLAVLIVPLISPAAVGEWDDDNWLTNIIGPERLEHGDEFGCHGYEGVKTTDENWVIEACRDYVNDFTEASRWGGQPISFGIPGDTIDPSTAEELVNSGFEIVGDKLTESPVNLVSMVRNGGSLEKGAFDRAKFESAEEDTLVSIYWRARVDDLKLREDKDAIEFIENQNVWFTTWGEWHNHGISGQEASESVTTDGSLIQVTLQSREQWNVPGTVKLQFEGNIQRVTDSSGDDILMIDESEKVLKSGWRILSDGMLLTIPPGSTFTIELDDESNVVSTPLTTFNDLHHAVTVVGHHTTNLFQWSSDFQESELRFTWLIERPVEIEMDWRLPVIAITALVATPIAIRWIVARDQQLQSSNEQSDES